MYALVSILESSVFTEFSRTSSSTDASHTWNRFASIFVALHVALLFALRVAHHDGFHVALLPYIELQFTPFSYIWHMFLLHWTYLNTLLRNYRTCHSYNIALSIYYYHLISLYSEDFKHVNSDQVLLPFICDLYQFIVANTFIFDQRASIITCSFIPYDSIRSSTAAIYSFGVIAFGPSISKSRTID